MRALMLAITILTITGCDDYQQAVEEAHHYCEMTKLYRSSGGERGWPDYNGSIKCEGEQ